MSQGDRQQALEHMLRNPAIWRAAREEHGNCTGISTGHAALDQALPAAGWPSDSLIELLCEQSGTGELSLLLPALRTLCADGRGIALVAPPHPPHARAWQAAGIALARLLIIDATGKACAWTAEQALRSGACGAVLMWESGVGRTLDHRMLQRLHLAAGTGQALCFLYRSIKTQISASPAPLRIRLQPYAGMLQAHIVKCRGVPRPTPVPVQLYPAHWQAFPARPAPVAAGSPSFHVQANLA